jgi:tricorn protease
MIAAALIASASVSASPLDARLMRWPTVSGDQVVFTYAGDLWTCDLKGGIARRLTSFPGLESRARFSPDGKTIAFTGQIDGGTDLYTIPADGGEPVRLTFDPGSENLLSWTPDGRLAFSSASQNLFTPRLFFTTTKGGQPVGTNLREITDGSFSPDGGTVAFTRMGSHVYNWRKYRGGTQGRISFFELATGKYSEIPSGREQSYHPMWVGEDVYFISDKDKKGINLYRYDTKSKKVDQITKFDDSDIRWPSTDGKTILWERLGKVEVYDIATQKVTEFSPQVLSDGRSLRPRWRNYANSIEAFSISPSGKRVVVTARGDVFSVPATSGQTRPLTTGNRSREKDAAWSPDGQSIAYLSDKSGEWQIMIEPQMGGEAKAVATPAEHRIRSFSWSPSGKFFSYETADSSLWIIPSAGGEAKKVVTDMYGSLGAYDWSPDETWIAFATSGSNLQSRIHAYNVETGTTTPITTGEYNDASPSFDLNGKFLYFVSARTFGMAESTLEGPNLGQSDMTRVYMVPLERSTPNPLLPPDDEEPVKASAPAAPPAAGGPPAASSKPSVKIDFEGIANRAIPLPWPAGNYPFVVGANGGAFTWTGGDLLQFSFATRQSVPIISGVTGVSFNPTRTKFAFMSGGQIGIADVRPGNTPATGRVNLSAVAGMWSPKDEYAQMFWEVWRWQRDVFYDPNMLGVDWKAMGQRYAAVLDSVGDRSDLNYLFGQLIGELGTGHAYVQGGELEGAPGAPVGLLGADYEVSGNSIRFAKVYEGFPDVPAAHGPLHNKGVKAGDFLVAIDGQDVTAATGVSSLLIDRVGRNVVLTVNERPSRVGAREVTVTPTPSEQVLRYETWVTERRAMVDELSGGKLGYFHVPNTSIQGIIGFVRGFYSQTDKEGWVIDERFNGGGFIPTFFVEALERQMDSGFQGRNGKPFGLPNQTLEGPKLMLINNYAGSGGDMFPWLFKNRGLGQLMGTRTWGGLVGIQGGLPLVDGGNVTSPGFGIFDTRRSEWIAENKGVDPDIAVDNDPSVIARGDDLQLRRAVEHLLDELKKGKGRKPIKTPPFPRRDGPL